MDWQTQLDCTSGSLAAIATIQREAGHAFAGSHRAAMSDGALTAKEFLALFIEISTRRVDRMFYI